MKPPHRTVIALAFALAFAGSFAATELQRKAFASRNSGGTYSLPAGNPVVSGTTITSTWGNTTMADVGTELTNSLDRSGRGGMLAPLACINGTASLPAFTFTAEPSSGLYRAGTNDLRMQVATNLIQQWVAGGTAVTGTLSATGAISTGGATVATQSYANTGDATTLTTSEAYTDAKFPLSRANLPSVNSNTSTSTGAGNTGSTTFVTFASASITTSGRPVLVYVQSDGTTSEAAMWESGAGGQTARFQFTRDGTTIGTYAMQQVTGGQTAVFKMPAILQVIDTPSSGAHTYRIQGLTTPSGGANLQFATLTAMEL